MTLKEAKKILKKEGFYVEKAVRPFAVSDSFTEYEGPTICEAMHVVNSAGYGISMESSRFDERKARLSLGLAESSAPMPGPGEEQPKEGNPALAESASPFNAALLDEQAKKIAELTRDKELMKKASLSQLDDFIEIYTLLTKESQKVKRLGKEIAKLNGIIHDKNAILSDVAEELRLTKIREKNLAELGLKYVVENEKLKKELADKVVDKIDAQALKSAESALAWKEKVIAEKDEVIAGLTHELKAKHKKYVWYKGAYDAAQQILNTIADYAAKHPDKKFSDQMAEGNHPTEDNPDEIATEKAVKRVRKALEEGADQSAIIAQYWKSIVDLSKKTKRLWQE